MSMTASKALAWAASQIGYCGGMTLPGSAFGRWYADKHGAYYGVPFCAMFQASQLTDDDGNWRSRRRFTCLTVTTPRQAAGQLRRSVESCSPGRTPRFHRDVICAGPRRPGR